MKTIKGALQQPITFFIFFMSFCGLVMLTGMMANYRIDEQQFVYLADAMLKGKLYFLEVPSVSEWADTSIFNGHFYWPLGVFPAIILMPFVAVFGVSFSQGYISLPLTLGTLYLLFAIAQKFTGRKRTSFLLAFAYVFSTAYLMIGTAHFSWYFAHVVTSFCLVASIYFTIVKPHPLLAGIFFTFSFLSRISVILGAPFFIAYYFFYEKKHFTRNVIRFTLPLIFGIMAFFAYNYARFGSIMESGYRYQILMPELTENRKVGMWSFRHFPMHIYLLFIKTPEVIYYEGTRVIRTISPSHWGMGFLYTSAIMLYLGFVNLKDRLNQISLLAALLIALFLFGSFGLGSYQYGYRFALDFQPFLFIMLCSVFKDRKLGVIPMAIIFGSFLLNSILIMGFFTSGRV